MLAEDASAQRWGRRRGYGRWDEYRDPRAGVPDWTVDPGFENDVFTFVRVRYESMWRYDAWRTDYPSSDLNFSYRLQQLTSLKVDPNGKVLGLTKPGIIRLSLSVSDRAWLDTADGR